jgi:NAD+ kinase
MKKIGIIANLAKPRTPEVLRRIAEKARALGLSLLAEEGAADLLKAPRGMATGAMLDQVDALLALGGDGTMLRCVRELNGRNKPVIGVNAGGLGFLTSVAEQELDGALECLAADRYRISEHPIAESRIVRGGAEVARYRAMNDVVVSRGAASRVVTLDVSIDADKVTSYVCDGLIVSTPLGSTAYSLSAGGPIVMPTTHAFVISVICPHTLSSRPLVVPSSSEIAVGVHDGHGHLLLSADGQVGQPLEDGDRVIVRRSERGVRFIDLPGYSYFGVLRQKLYWSGSSVR